MTSNINNNPFNITILTLYPKQIKDFFSYGVLFNALKSNIWNLNVINIRDFAFNKYKSVDDKPYGGGNGMILMPDILGNCIDFAMQNGASSNLIYPTPKGKIFNNDMAKNFSQLNGLTFICGHFEGIDERIIEYYKPTEVSVGDYVLTGGELATLNIIDSTLRFLKNVLQCENSFLEESLENNLLEHPQYSKPREWRGLKVPEVLLNGNHKEIKQWQLKQRLDITKDRRLDLYNKYIQRKD